MLESPVNKALAMLALKLIATQVPEPDDAGPWEMDRRLMPHATKMFENFNHWKIENTEAAWKLVRLANLHYRQEKLDQAAALYQRAFEGNYQTLGPNHNSTLQVLQNLGTIAGRQGRLGDAESLYRKVLHQKEACGCSSDIVTLHTMANLGVTLLKLDQLKEAENLLKTAFDGKQVLVGEGQPPRASCSSTSRRTAPET